MESTIREILTNYDGMVLGGNDFLYTKELVSHPMSSFLYTYGFLLRELGVDTIFLENHYTKEPIQTRGFISQVMYSAYCFGMRVIGIEGKFTPEEYKQYTSVVMEKECTTVAYTSKKRLDRLNIFVSHFVPCQMRSSSGGKYLLFCGMSHVNNEPEVTECKGIKVLLGVPGIGATYTDKNESLLVKGKPFSDFGSGYVRDTDYLLELKRDKIVEERLYIDSFTFSMIHDYYFFYKSYHRLCTHLGIKPSVASLWNHHTTTIYPPRYKEYIDLFIDWDPRMKLEDSEINDVLSYLHEVIHSLRDIPSRKKIVEATQGLQESDLDFIVDQWVSWIKVHNKKKDLNKEQLDILSDIIFLEYKKLSEERTEKGYVKYLKNKYRKQLERPEHKIYTMSRILKSIGLPRSTPANQRIVLLEKII